MAAMNEPFLLVLDHFEAVTNRDCLDAVAAIALRLPPGSQLAIGSRDELPLPDRATARPRGTRRDRVRGPRHGRGGGADALLDGRGSTRPRPPRDLLEKTEGWPVGLYLASLDDQRRERPSRGWRALHGGRLLRRRLPPLRAARPARSGRGRVPDPDSRSSTACADRCATSPWAVPGSDRTPRPALESRNLLVIPLDRRREWYRYHHLFRELLASELLRREPEMVPVAPPPGGVVVRGERPARDRDRARPGGR